VRSKHQRCHIAEEDRPWPCETQGCPRRFLYPAYRKRHQEEDHLGVLHNCPKCDFSCKKLSNLFGKGRHFETQHPGAKRPTQKVEEIQPGLGTPGPANSLLASAVSPPPRKLQTPATPARKVVSPLHTPSAPPQTLAPSLGIEQRHDASRLHPELRHFDQQLQTRQPSYGGAHASSSSASSSRRTRVATPPSRYTSSSVPESSRSRAPSNSFSSQISRLSTPSTAPTSYTSSIRRRSSSGRAVQGLMRSQDAPPTPTRSPRELTSTHAAMYSCSPRILRSTRRSDGDVSFSLPDRTRGRDRW